MSGQELKDLRCRHGWAQQELAARLGVSQGYVSMLEAGKRRLTAAFGRRLARVLGLPPTRLPLPEAGQEERTSDNETLAGYLARLGYPGFAYMRARHRSKNPAEVLLAALSKNDLEARLAEALPWVVLHYSDMDNAWLVRQARLHNLQNRLGYVVALARQVAEARAPYHDRVELLRRLETELERSRLAHEDTFCQGSLSDGERQWLRENRPLLAAHWNLLADWRPESLRYVV